MESLVGIRDLQENDLHMKKMLSTVQITVSLKGDGVKFNRSFCSPLK